MIWLEIQNHGILIFNCCIIYFVHILRSVNTDDFYAFPPFIRGTCSNSSDNFYPVNMVNEKMLLIPQSVYESHGAHVAGSLSSRIRKEH